MARQIWCLIFILACQTFFPEAPLARGTRYFIAWPSYHLGPVYVQIYDIQCNPPYETLDRFQIWVTWDGQTACYKVGNVGTYLFKFYKHEYHKGPMIVFGNAASFRVRYSLSPPWI